MIEKKKDKGIILVKCIAISLVIIGHSLQTVTGQSKHYSAAVYSSLLNADACLARITDKRRSYRLEMNGISMREPVK